MSNPDSQRGPVASPKGGFSQSAYSSRGRVPLCVFGPGGDYRIEYMPEVKAMNSKNVVGWIAIGIFLAVLTAIVLWMSP